MNKETRILHLESRKAKLAQNEKTNYNLLRKINRELRKLNGGAND